MLSTSRVATLSFVLSTLLMSELQVYVAEKLQTDDADVEVIEGFGGSIAVAEDDGVLVLNKDNFDFIVKPKAIILVEFFAPWCGHCQALAPEYAKAAQQLKLSDPPIPLAKVDATVEEELATRFEVNGYPTLYIFRKGEKFPYEGPRTAAGIVDYMHEQADPNWKPPPESVITLTQENFTDTVNAADLILVEFYAPWCGHCKRLAPEYERAARTLRETSPTIPLAKVDAIAEKDLSEKFGVTGYPTLFLFRKGRKFDYLGPRTETGIVSYMKKQMEPASIEVDTSKSVLLKKFSKTGITVVGYFKDEDEPLFAEYIAAANEYREKVTFLHTFQTKITSEMKEKVCSIVLYQPEMLRSEYEPSAFRFSLASGTSEDIRHFIGNASVPYVGHRTYSTSWQYESKYPLVVVYYDVDFSFDNRVQTQLIRKEVLKVAKDYQGRVVFAVSNEEEYNHEIKDLGLDDSGEDVNVGFFSSPKARYRMEPDEEFSSEVLREFVENVLAGKVPRYFKSLPIPANNPGPLITVVANSFEKLVMKSDKHMLLEFYAPWCGHCKKLEPTYKKLAKAFADNDSIVIAKIDATANDYPEEFVVSGFPTIYFIPASDKKNPQQYSGDRSYKDLLNFVNEKLKSYMMESPKDEL